MNQFNKIGETPLSQLSTPPLNQHLGVHSSPGLSLQTNQQELLISSNSNFYNEMVEQCYRHKPAFGLYEKVIEIEKWFHEERKSISALQNSNTPLVIVGPEGSGKTTLLFQWMEFHEAKSEFFTNIFDKNSYFLYFVNSSTVKNSHYSMLYHLINRIRIEFDLNQRIEMQNDKIRTFFQRWLELADKKKQFNTTEKCKIILIIDGIDKLETEESNQNFQSNKKSPHYQNSNDILENSLYQNIEESPDWLPNSFPLSFRVILTCRPNSKSHKYFKNMKIPFRFLNLSFNKDSESNVILQIVESHFNTSSSIAYDSQEEFQQKKQEALTTIGDYLQNKDMQSSFKNKLFVHTYLNIVYPQMLDLRKTKIKNFISLEDVKDKLTVDDLFKYCLKHYEAQIFPKSKFRRICCVMALAKTGLSKQELKDCLEVHVQYIDLYLKIFQFALLEYKNLFRINNESYKKSIMQMYFQEEIYKNEIHSSIVTILSKTKHFNQNPRLIDEVSYNIYKQGNQWLKLKDLLSNLEIFCQMYKSEDKYQLCQYWQKLEQHGFDPVYEYNKTVEAFVLNYFPTSNELFVILAQIARFFKELGDLETKWTPEFKHPPLLISQELDNIKLRKELELVGGMLIELKNNQAPVQEEEIYNIENPLFMQVYREKQVVQLSKENPLFQICQFYYYKRWVWLQFPWFCMDITSSFSFYMLKTIGSALHLHMNNELERDLVQGCLKILREAKSRKQKSGKHILYQLPQELLAINDIDDVDEQEQEDKDRSEDDDFDDDIIQQIDINDTRKSNIFAQSPQLSQKSLTGHQIRQQVKALKLDFQQQQQLQHQQYQSQQVHSQRTISTAQIGERTSINKQGKALFINQATIQSPIPILDRENSTEQTRQSVTQMSHRSYNKKGFQTERGGFIQEIGLKPASAKKSEYIKAKIRWIETDFALSNLKSKFLPENGVRLVGSKVKNYENKELSHYIQINRELVNEFNRISFEIQQKEKIFQSLQNCIVEVDYNNKETQAFEKRLNSLQEKLQQTRTSYKISKKEQYRLKHIVNYCFKNKADNHEWIQGLELAVKNMVTLIKHERENVINAKNQVTELKKQRKEMSKTKNERKNLQQKTMKVVTELTEEKRQIKEIREVYEKKQQSISIQNQRILTATQMISREKGQPKRKLSQNDDEEFKRNLAFVENQQEFIGRQAFSQRIKSQQQHQQMSQIGRQRLTTAAHSQRNLYSISPNATPLLKNKSTFQIQNQEGKVIEDQMSLSSQSNKEQLRVQIEQFQQRTGSKEVEDLKFFQSFLQLQKIKEERELKVKLLKEERKLLMEQLNVFHNQDTDKSNLKYQRDKLMNNIGEDIDHQRLQLNIKKEMHEKWDNLIIETRILIEELRKKMNLDISGFQKSHRKILANQMIGNIEEIANIINLKKDFIEECFGTSDFHSVMVQIQQNDEYSMRQIIISKKDKDMYLKQLQENISKKIKSNTENLDENLKSNEALLFQGFSQKKGFSERQPSGKRSGRNQQQKLSGKKTTNQDLKAPNIILGGGTVTGNGGGLAVIHKSQSQSSLNKDLEDSKLSKFKLDFQQAQQFTNQSRAPLTKRLSKFSNDCIIINLHPPNTQRPAYENSYQISLKTFNLPLQEIEKILYNENQNEEDQVRVAFDAMNEFKRQQQDYIQDESFLYLEEQRQNLKERKSKFIIQEEEANHQGKGEGVTNKEKRSKSLASGGSKLKKFAKSSVELFAKKDNQEHIQNKNIEQDIVPHQQNLEERTTIQNDDAMSSQVKRDDSSRAQVKSSLITNQKDLQGKAQLRRQSMGSYLSMEAEKLPKYAQAILKGSHKEVLKKLKLLNLKVAKLEDDVVIKKLASQQEDEKYRQWKEFYKQSNQRLSSVGGSSTMRLQNK